ncbi:carbohydrate kinase family protein [Fibrella forsythiae]|uniref:Carbohydrate kinase n=1 Tax=Fibrella forsythiae TaxID=2817061 RepID=A0ABS3JIR2_9BACT|nr:carbohydrate kinase [Fibrella forsythiae]MBO0949890.1 carbohydrate kinase [Fibrella forsythiae]
MKKITCFGEILWDVLPTSKQPGGAPMNVAADLRNFGLNAQLISAVGHDALGRELLNFLEQKAIPTDLVQVSDTYPTGVAQANVSDSNDVVYTIVQPVAWDYIQLQPGMIEAVQQSDLFIYGSLAARSSRTYETLRELLDVAPRKIFDVNLRAPHYDRETVDELMHQADIAKLNEHEILELSDWYGYDLDLQRAMRQIRDRFNLEALCVTLGDDGAILLDAAGFTRQESFPIDVEDTIGCGDAFLAAYIHKTLQGETPQKTLAFACAAGAYVGTQPGATPSFTEQTILRQYNVASAA